jgi:hypothetical protein
MNGSKGAASANSSNPLVVKEPAYMWDTLAGAQDSGRAVPSSPGHPKSPSQFQMDSKGWATNSLLLGHPSFSAESPQCQETFQS